MTSTETTPDVRERLIQGTFDVLAGGEGVEALTVRRIATAAGRSTMCVYSKFGNRRRLLQEVYHRAGAGLAESLTRAKPVQADRALGVAAAYRRFARRHPEQYALLFEYPLAPLELPPAVRQEAIQQVVDALGGERSYLTWATMHGQLVLERAWAPARRAPWSDDGWEHDYLDAVAATL